MYRPQRENFAHLLRHPARKPVHALLQYKICKPVAVDMVMMSKLAIGHLGEVHPELYSVAMMNCCAAVGYTNKVYFIFLQSLLIYRGEKDCKVKQEVAGC